jgi:hypothetical protein
LLGIDGDGRLVVPAHYVRRLGDRSIDRGKGALERIIADIRGRRVLLLARQASGAISGR